MCLVLPHGCTCMHPENKKSHNYQKINGEQSGTFPKVWESCTCCYIHIKIFVVQSITAQTDIKTLTQQCITDK